VRRDILIMRKEGNKARKQEARKQESKKGRKARKKKGRNEETKKGRKE